MLTTETPEAVLHPVEPLWAGNAEEDPRAETRREAHLIVRVGPSEFHGFRTRCGLALSGVMSSIRTAFNRPPSGMDVCAECRAAAAGDARTS